MKYTSLRKRCV